MYNLLKSCWHWEGKETLKMPFYMWINQKTNKSGINLSLLKFLISVGKSVPTNVISDSRKKKKKKRILQFQSLHRISLTLQFNCEVQKSAICIKFFYYSCTTVIISISTSLLLKLMPGFTLRIQDTWLLSCNSLMQLWDAVQVVHRLVNFHITMKVLLLDAGSLSGKLTMGHGICILHLPNHQDIDCFAIAILH